MAIYTRCSELLLELGLRLVVQEDESDERQKTNDVQKSHFFEEGNSQDENSDHGEEVLLLPAHAGTGSFCGTGTAGWIGAIG